MDLEQEHAPQQTPGPPDKVQGNGRFDGSLVTAKQTGCGPCRSPLVRRRGNPQECRYRQRFTATTRQLVSEIRTCSEILNNTKADRLSKNYRRGDDGTVIGADAGAGAHPATVRNHASPPPESRGNELPGRMCRNSPPLCDKNGTDAAKEGKETGGGAGRQVTDHDGEQGERRAQLYPNGGPTAVVRWGPVETFTDLIEHGRRATRSVGRSE